MYKSVYAIGLLASSLVMLVIMPFLSQSNNFLLNSAMAQEYDTDHYERYAMGDMVANEYESYRNYNYYHETDPDYYYDYPSYNEDHKSDFRSYPSDDNYEKSYDKSNQNSSVTENDCININNINVDNTENINAGINSDGVSATENENEERLDANSYGNNGQKYDDEYMKDKSVVCIIINNYINVAGDGDGDGVGTPNSCLECFNSFRFGGPLTPELRDNLDRYLATTPVVVGDHQPQIVGYVGGLCNLIHADQGITVAQITNILTNAFQTPAPNIIAAVIECLQDQLLIK